MSISKARICALAHFYGLQVPKFLDTEVGTYLAILGIRYLSGCRIECASEVGKQLLGGATLVDSWEKSWILKIFRSPDHILYN